MNAVQVALPFGGRNWGGKRKGAGRKPRGARSRVSHAKRPVLSRHHPVHVTVRVVKDVANLRTKQRVKVVERAMVDSAGRFGFNVVHFSVLKNHIHLIAEAENENSLARGMKGLLVRIARRLNKLLGRKGRVFSDRYHARVLKGPREARNALAYVLLNARRHAAQLGRRLPSHWIDPFSTCRWFEGFVSPGGNRLRSLKPPSTSPLKPPSRWVLQDGWQKFGLIPINLVPG